MPKNLEDLGKSRKIQKWFILHYGFVPESIMKADWSIRTDRRNQETYMKKMYQSGYMDKPGQEGPSG